MKDKDMSSLEHTGWRCQCPVVFAPKDRRELCGEIKQAIGVLLRRLSQQKSVEIVEAKACPDHIPRLIRNPPKDRAAQRMAYQ